MRLKIFLAALLMLAPLPALADVTARYAVGPSTVTVAAADNGDSRFDIDAQVKVSILRHDGVDYMVMTGDDGVARVTLAKPAFGLLIGQMSPPDPAAPVFTASSTGPGSLLGYSGTLWRYCPADEPPLELLMSPDPRLARVGDVFRNLIELVIGASGSLLGPDQLRQVFASGAPLRIASLNPGKTELLIELQSVDTAKIDPARFALPGPVPPPEEFAKTVMAPDQPRTVTVEVPQR